MSWNLSYTPNTDPYHRILDLIDDIKVNGKDVRSIDYKMELAKDIRLHGDHIFNDDGTIDKTIYYHGWTDAQNPGTPILEVRESYTYDSAQSALFKSQQRILSRQKEWHYYLTDGSTTLENTKIKQYNTRNKQREESERRRSNLLDIAQVNIATAGILMGHYADEEAANDDLTSLFEEFAAAFSAYNKSGRGTIYDDILNDTDHAALNVLVDSAVNAMVTTLIPQMDGMTIRSYAIEKLKGHIA